MEFLDTLRLLWRRRLLVGIGAVVAVAAAVAIAQGWMLGPADAHRTGVASGSVLIDTPRSQLLNVDPKGADTLSTRALLFAELLASEPVKAGIARKAGLEPDQVDVLPPSSRLEPAVSTPLVEQTTAVAAAPRAPSLLKVYTDGESPMISLDARATDGRRAVTLIEAATGALRTMVQRETARGGQFVVDVVRAPRAKEHVSHSHGSVLALIGALVIFALSSGIIVVASGLADWRRGGIGAPEST